jgi:hypothetical protein
LSGSVYGTILTSSILVAPSYKERGTALVIIAALAVTEQHGDPVHRRRRAGARRGDTDARHARHRRVDMRSSSR